MHQLEQEEKPYHEQEKEKEDLVLIKWDLPWEEFFSHITIRSTPKNISPSREVLMEKNFSLTSLLVVPRKIFLLVVRFMWNINK